MIATISGPFIDLRPPWHAIAVLENGCLTHLATLTDVPVGVYGTAWASSFYPAKNRGALGRERGLT